MRLLATTVIAILALSATPATAKIVAASDNGFAVRHEAEVTVDPETAYDMLRAPAKWWNGEHSWTGNAENLYMDAQAGGCFCELIPADESAEKRVLRGSVQHMRILYAEPGKMLRLSGALGPLQSEAVTGTLTIMLKPTAQGTALSFEYVVGGYMRFSVDEIAPAVDGVIGEQLTRLANIVGPVLGGGAAVEESGEGPAPEDVPFGFEGSAERDTGAMADDEPADAEPAENPRSENARRLEAVVGDLSNDDDVVGWGDDIDKPVGGDEPQ